MELALVVPVGVVGPVDSLGSGIPEEAVHCRIGEAGALPCAIPRLVEKPGDALHALLLGEEFIHHLADRSFCRIYDKLVLLPHVSEWSGAAQVLAEFCPNIDGGLDPVGDFLSLPLGESGNHGVKEATGGSRGVDLLL